MSVVLLIGGYECALTSVVKLLSNKLSDELKTIMFESF